MSQQAGAKQFDRAWGYALIGLVLGLLAPVGWWVIRQLFFPESAELAAGAAEAKLLSQTLNLYMGGGTAVVLGVFGFFIGKSSQQILDRARKLDELNHAVETQKLEYERRFNNLNHGIKNFHAINMHIQKTSDSREVLTLAADGLHDILGYDRVNILMTDRATGVLRLVASRGHELDAPLEQVVLPLDQRAGALFKSVNEKQVLLIDDIRKMPAEYHLQPPCDKYSILRSRTFVLCPIVVQQEVVGLFGVDNKLKQTMLDETDVDTVKLFADQVASTLTKLNLLEGVESLTGQLLSTFSQLRGYQQDYDRLDQDLRVATDSNIEATRDISGAAEVVRESVDSTRSSSGEISVSIQQVAENLARLAEFVSNSIATVTQINATVQSVQDHAVRSHGMSETVKHQAEKGTGGVRRAMQGLEGISRAVQTVADNIETLSRTGEEAGNITTVITEITRKTGLLALNAAIIAAQAGEHGRPFAVVADEVSALSRETATSAEAIASLIETMQSATTETVTSMQETSKLVSDGLHLGHELEQALTEILESSELAMGMSLEIRRSTHEVARSVEAVQRAIVELGEMSSQASHASREEAQATRSIVRAIEEIKNMAEDMVAATGRQQQNSAAIDNAFGQVSQMSRKIFAALEERRSESLDVVQQLEGLRQVSAGGV